MQCPFCNQQDTKVIDSRLVLDGSQVRRRRECISCHERFTTYEVAEMIMPLVIKRDGRRESFSIENLRAGMLRSLEKRTFSVDTLEQAISVIVQKIRSRGEREVDSQVIGELVMEQLYRLDHVAYVRFASVYKRFQDVSEFRQTIEQMKQDDKF